MQEIRKVNAYTAVGRHLLWFYSDEKLLGYEESVSSSVHSHSIYDVHYVCSGSYTIVTDGESIHVRPGYIYIIAPGIYHHTIADPDNREPIRRICFKFSFTHVLEKQDSRISDTQDEAVVKGLSLIRCCERVTDDFGFESLIERIRSEYFETAVGSRQMLQSLLTELIVHISRRLYRQITESEADLRRTGDMRYEAIEEYFSLYYSQDCNQEQLAQSLHMSTRQLNRLIHSFFGMGFKEKLMQARVSAAKDLLISTDCPGADIAERCGYAYESSLCHSFRRVTGMTPNEYRRQHRRPPHTAY